MKLNLIFTLLVSSLFFSNLQAQTEASLCHLIDSLSSAHELKLLIPPGEALRQKMKQEGAKDVDACARAQIKVASALRVLNHYQKADSLFLEIDLLLPAESIGRANWLVNYAVMDIILSNGEKADSLLQAGLEMHKRWHNEHTPEYMSGLLFKAQFEEYYGESGACQQTCLDAIEQWKAAALPELSLLGAIYCLLAGAYDENGWFTKEQEAYQSGFAIFERRCKPDNPVYLLYRGNYINFLIQKSDIGEGVKELKDYKAVIENSPTTTPFLRINLLSKQANLESELNRFEAALAFDKAAFDLSSQTMPYSYTVFKHQAVALDLSNLHRYEEEEAILHAMEDSMRIYNIKNRAMNAFIAAELADCRKSPKESIPLLEKSVAIYQQLTDRKDAGRYSNVISRLAYKYLEDNRLSDAENTLAQLDSLEYYVLDGDLGLQSYRRIKGILEEQKNNTELAWQYWRKWSDDEKKVSLNQIWLVNTIRQYENLTLLRDKNDIMLSALERDPTPPVNTLGYVLDFELLTKSLLLSNAQIIRKNIENGSSGNATRQLFSDLKEARERLSWCYTQSKQDLADKNIQVDELEKTADSLELELSRNSKAFGEASLRQPFSWTDVQQKLQPGEAAIEMVRFEYNDLRQANSFYYAVFIIDRQSTQPHVVFLTQTDQIELTGIEKYLTECASPNGKGETGDLYESFWKKIEPYLKDISRIYISADGAFFKINTGAIQLPGGQYVTDRYDIHNVFSLKDVGSNAPDIQMNPKTALLAGNPAFLITNTSENQSPMRSVTETPDSLQHYDPLSGILLEAGQTRGLSLSPLPGSAIEVNNIAALLNKKGWQTTVLTGQLANEVSIKSFARPTVLHLATHGYFLSNIRSGTAGISRSVLETNPMMRSMLFFAGAQNTLDKNPVGEEDGIFTAFEAQNLDLTGTELVVLSACQTAQGKIHNGEGVYGLQRALRIAGAQSVLLSLWDVDDKVGREFMVLFYEKWLNGMTKQDAFRATQLAIKKKHPQPFYWAGLVLIE